jgi:hypothetical protein
MVWGVVAAAVIIGLLSLINAAAANALFSLAVAGNDRAWMMPILCRLVWGEERFHPGVFYTGRFSKPIAVTAIVYLGFAIVLCMFPTLGPGPTGMLSFSFSFYVTFYFTFCFPCFVAVGCVLTRPCWSSRGYELYRGHQWCALGWCFAILRSVCAKDIQGPADHGAIGIVLFYSV